jgi:hypothetical protein
MRLRGIDGVQRAENHVSRLGRGKGDLHRFAIADFSDENRLGRLPQRRPQSDWKAEEILAEFALTETRPRRRMHVFDGIFQRHHVDVLRAVQFIEDGRQRSGFAGPSRTGHENNARVFLDDFGRRAANRVYPVAERCWTTCATPTRAARSADKCWRETGPAPATHNCNRTNRSGADYPPAS